MSEWLTSLEGTPAGHQAALVLALMAALLHALFGALQKGRHDPWLSRAVIDALHAKGVKVVAFRFKRRKNVRVKRGHRQGYTHVKITAIEG